MSRNSPSMKTAGRRGYQPFAHCLIPGNVVADTWKTYEAAALEAGRTAEARRLEGRPLDLPGRHDQGSPQPGAHQFAGRRTTSTSAGCSTRGWAAGSTSAIWT